MKKALIIIILLISSGMAVGCQRTKTSLSMMVPFGSPQLAQLYMQASDDYEVDIVMGPDLLTSAFGAQSHDVIFAPTNLGARLYQGGSPYRLAAVIVWGNFYLVSKDQITLSQASLQGKTIHVFGQNQTSDIMLSFVLNHYDIDIEIIYVDSVSTAQGLLVSDQADIILTAEPSLSVLNLNVSNLSVIDLQNAYQDITGLLSYPQASMFVHERLTPNQVEMVLKDLEDSIDLVNNNHESAVDLAISLEINLAREALMSAIPRSHLMFMHANDAKSAIESYFQIILDKNPMMIGGSLPIDDFYLV